MAKQPNTPLRTAYTAFYIVGVGILAAGIMEIVRKGTPFGLDSTIAGILFIALGVVAFAVGFAMSKGTKQSYMLGMVFSIIVTAIAAALFIMNDADEFKTVYLVAGLAPILILLLKSTREVYLK